MRDVNTSELVDGLRDVYENSIAEQIRHLLNFQLEKYKESMDKVTSVDVKDGLIRLSCEE